MTKTPEQMAEEYAKEHHMGGWEYEASIPAWLAGYQAAKSEDKAKWDAAHERMVAEYEANSPKNSNSSDDSDTPDLQEQVEALQAYMTVAQRKIMVLQANVEFLLYHNKEKIGEGETIRRMQQTIQGFGRKDE
jgi:predicted RNase H-like nuclease (RuvC/YqgF family)